MLPSFVLLVITYAKCKASGGSVPWHGTACYVVAEDGTTTEQATAQSVRLAEATGVSLILKGFRVLRIFKAERYTRHVSIIRDGPSIETERSRVASRYSSPFFLRRWKFLLTFIRARTCAIAALQASRGRRTSCGRPSRTRFSS